MLTRPRNAWKGAFQIWNLLNKMVLGKRAASVPSPSGKLFVLRITKRSNKSETGEGLEIHCQRGEQNLKYNKFRGGTFPMNMQPTRTVLQNAGASKESPIATEECQVPVAVTNAQMIDKLSNTKHTG